MKIVQIIYDLSSGGAEKFTVDLSNQLSLTNEVYLCVVQKENYEKNFFKDQINPRVNYINLGRSRGINLITFMTIIKLINRLKPAIVHAHLNTVMYLYLPALLFNRKIKFVHTLHSIAPKTIGFKWQKGINRFLYRSNLINAIAISKQNKKSFIDFYNIQNIELIENGVPGLIKTNKFRYVKEEILKLKHHPSDIVFIHIARFAKPKNQQMLIAVFNKIIEKGFDVILVIIGSGYNTEEAKKIIKDSKQEIFFLGPKNNISDYLLNSDIFILSSTREGMPLSLLEALSSGVIPVCTPAGGIPDIIQDETIGFLSKDLTEEGLFRAVIKCLNALGDFNRSYLKRFYTENFSIEKCAEKYQVFYQSESKVEH